MPDFEVKISTPVQLAGAKALADQLERDIGKAKALGEATDELEKKLKSVNTAIAAAAPAATEATEHLKLFGRGAHEAHAALHALGMGNLARDLFNPTTLAIGAWTLAFKELNDVLEENRRQIAETVKVAREMREELADAISHGAQEAAEKIHSLRVAHEQLAVSIDTATAAMKNQLKQLQQERNFADTIASAYQNMASAKINALKASGSKTQIDAQERIDEIKRDDEHHKALVDEKEKKDEIAAKQARANAASGEATAARKKLGGMEPDLTSADAAVIHAQDELDRRKDALKKAQDAADKANAAAETNKSRILTPADLAGSFRNKQAANKALSEAGGDVTTQESVLANAKHQKEAMEKEADRLEKLADAREELAHKLIEEISESQASITASKTAREAKEKIDNQTAGIEQLTRETEGRKQLENKKTRTFEEDRELSDLQIRDQERQATGSRARGALPAETKSLVDSANAALTHARQGQGSWDEIHEVLQRVIGHQEASVTESATKKQDIEQVKRRLEELDQRMSGGSGGYIH